MMTSARNQLAGRVTRVTTGAVNDTVLIEISGGSRITATITRESTELLQLGAGAPVTALIKAPWIVLASGADAAARCSADNAWSGTVRRIVRGAVNGEVVLELPGGQTLAAVVTLDSLERLALRDGAPSVALFNAASVILARVD